MWSDRYYYFKIYKDQELSSNCDSEKLRDFINKIPELKQVEEYSFTNVVPFPFTQLLFLKARSINSWSNNDVDPQHSNLIDIVCAKGKEVDYEELKRVFVQIAIFLNWKLVEEETDDGIEDFIIWE